MYLKRKVDAYLKNWKQDIHKKPLIIKGARQIGKTETFYGLKRKIMRMLSISILHWNLNLR